MKAHSLPPEQPGQSSPNSTMAGFPVVVVTSDPMDNANGCDGVVVPSLSTKPTNEYVLNVAFLSFLLFTIMQMFFALLARSHAMLEDCAAMFVDVITYLFNFLAERFKHEVHNDPTMSPRNVRLYRLYLELVPPFISVATLVVVTVMGLQDAIQTIREPPVQQESQPDIKIMLIFSALNMLLDVLNVSCFARIDQAAGLVALAAHHTQHDKEMNNHKKNNATAPTESTLLLPPGNADPDTDDHSIASVDTEATGGLNLNMCSAWTHVCADTLRSIAVLMAAGIATLFPAALTPADADSWAAIVVSVIILISLVPLFEGLYLTACKIHHLWYHAHDTDLTTSSSSRLHTDVIFTVV